MSEIEALYAYGFFVVTRDLKVHQTIVFEYLDLDRYYASLAENIEALDQELEALAASMQEFLDKEEVVINGERVRPRVTAVDLGFKGEPEEVYVIYFIEFRGKPRKGVNYYENLYEEEMAEYPFVAYWLFPPGAKIISVEASGTTELLGDNILVIRVEEGEVFVFRN